MWQGSWLPLEALCGPSASRFSEAIGLSKRHASHANALMRPNRTQMLILSGAAIVALMAFSQRDALSESIAQLHPGWTLVALITLALANFSMAVVFGIIATINSTQHVSSLNFAAVYLLAQASKYLPGKVWPIATQFIYLHGRAEKTTIAVGNFETALVSLTVTTAIGVGMLYYVHYSKALGVSVIILGMIVGWLIGRSPVLKTIIRQTILRARLEQLEPRRASSASNAPATALFGSVSAFTFFYIIGWCGFVGLAIGHDWDTTLRLVGLMSISYVVGVLSLMPAGIGTRELSMVALAAIFGLDVGLASAVAVMTRITLLAIDGTGIIFGALILKWLPALREEGGQNGEL